MKIIFKRGKERVPYIEDLTIASMRSHTTLAVVDSIVDMRMEVIIDPISNAVNFE